MADNTSANPVLAACRGIMCRRVGVHHGFIHPLLEPCRRLPDNTTRKSAADGAGSLSRQTSQRRTKRTTNRPGGDGSPGHIELDGIGVVIAVSHQHRQPLRAGGGCQTASRRAIG